MAKFPKSDDPSLAGDTPTAAEVSPMTLPGSVTSLLGEKVHLPKRLRDREPTSPLLQNRPAEPVDVGAQVAERPARETAGSGKRTMGAREAGKLSDAFVGGAEAFGLWCASKGIEVRERRTLSEWQPLLAEFAKRAIHGHRRTAAGGSHRVNRKDLR